MARCHCRWQNVLICVCTPCIFLALLFVYVTVMMCTIMTSRGQGQIGSAPDHFVATGIVRNKSFAPIPETFWDLHPNGDAIWNRLQLASDRHFNPILQPNNVKMGFKNGTFHESLLKQSFSEVTTPNGMRQYLDKVPKQMQEFASHMQRRDYPTLLQPNGVCGAGANNDTEPPLLLLAIKTSMSSFKNRQAIRHTWGKEGWVSEQNGDTNRGGGYVRRVFLLGKEDPEELGVDLSELLQMESRRYGDILQWDFKDTFFNLTLKDVLFWDWFSRVCSGTRFVLKGDDDVFINTPKMITYLQDQLKKPQAYKAMKDFMVGNVLAAATPIRVNKSKYFIPDSFYKGLYPAYAGGGGVVYSGLLAKRLNDMSSRVHLFPIDDVYVGMCMIRLNAHPINHPAFLTFDFPGEEEEELCPYHRILLVHKRSPDQLVQLWANLKKTQTQCWDVSLRDDNKNQL